VILSVFVCVPPDDGAGQVDTRGKGGLAPPSAQGGQGISQGHGEHSEKDGEAAKNKAPDAREKA